MKVYGLVPPEPVKVIFGELAFTQTAVVPLIVAVGTGFTTTVTPVEAALKQPAAFWDLTK